MLEQKLSVEAVAHGNVIVVKGSESGCAMARDVLEHLYSRLKSGHTIALGDVDGAIRHANAGIRHQKDKDKGERHRTRPAPHPQAAGFGAHAYADPLHRGASGQGTDLRDRPGGHRQNLSRRRARGRRGWSAARPSGSSCRARRSRPASGSGFLPGDLREKVDPYLRPLYDALYDVLPAEKVERDLESGVIEIAPLAFMRGRTLSHATIILDEAQNCTSMQMKMFLTRLGEGSKMVVTGDPSQIDLPPGQVSGLREAIGILEDVKGIAHIPFTSADVVRHELVPRIVEAYDKAR